MPLWKQDQEQSLWNDLDLPLVKCSFGAAVARAFHEGHREIPYGYREEYGRHVLGEYLHLSINDLDSLLWLCGAGRFPFSKIPWELPVEKVLANLKKIERKPTDEEFHILYKKRMVLVRHSPRKIREIWDRITDSEAVGC